MEKKIAVIIVNWNGKKYLEGCLDSLRRQSFQNFEIILVDNGSTDDSILFTRKNYPEAEILELEKNTGFSFANNVGIKKSFESPEVKYVVALNNDTELDEKYLESLFECAKKNQKIGSIQPKVLNFENRGKIDNVGIVPSYFGMAFNLGEGENDGEKFSKEKEIFGANATAALYSREALEKTKISDGEYFDNSFFAYFEDVDLAWRIRLAGFKSFFCPEAKVFHFHGATGKEISEKRFLTYRNSFASLFENYPLVFLISSLILLPVQMAIIIFKKRKPRDLAYIAKSLGYVIKNWNLISKKRSLNKKNRNAKNSEIGKWMRFEK